MKITYMKNLIALLFSICISSHVYSQQLTKSQLNDLIWEQFGNANSLTFNEITKSGRFAGCEVVYRYTYRDYRSRNGEPVILVGSITSSYTKGKAFSLFLKVQPQVIELSGKTAKLKSIPINFATMKIGNIDLDKYRVTKFTCEDGGYCAGYASSKPDFMEATLSKTPINPDIYITLTPNGIDSKFKLSEIKENGAAPNSLMDQFTLCIAKILEEQIKDLENR